MSSTLYFRGSGLKRVDDFLFLKYPISLAKCDVLNHFV